MEEAAYYAALENGAVRCELCPNHCILTEGKRGLCLTRRNVGGKLVTLNYCRPVSVAIDPIEKKPLYHFHPGTRILSTGPNGCTLKCSFCQNHEISQGILSTREVEPERLVEAAVDNETIGIAYTYSEPSIWFETIMEVGARVREEGLVNVMVTNGYLEEGPLSQLLEVVDAMNIDIKSMNPDFYRRLCKGELAPVLRTCETVKPRCHLEITNLLIPGENDAEEDVRALARFIADNLGRDTPLHLSRYFPRYRMDKPPTTHHTLERAWHIASDLLDFVYVGNAADSNRECTYCPGCRTLLINRAGYATVVSPALIAGPEGIATCRECGAGVNVVVGRV